MGFGRGNIGNKSLWLTTVSDDTAKLALKIQDDNQSIAIDEIHITGTVTGNITIGHTIVAMP